MFVQFDNNKDGKIQVYEIKKNLFDYSGGEAIIDVLMGADINDDGEIGYEEFMLALTDPNFFIKSANLKKAFEKFDTNNDGNIDL